MKYRYLAYGFAATSMIALGAAPVFAATISCTHARTNDLISGDALYTAYVACRETIIAPMVTNYDMDTADWDQGFGIDSGRCDPALPFARTVNAIYALSNSVTNPIFSGPYGSDPLRFGGYYSRTEIAELDGRCNSAEFPGAHAQTASGLGDNYTELFMPFFYDDSVVERAGGLMHETVHADITASHESGSTSFCQIPKACDDHYPSHTSWSYQADFLGAYSIRAVNGNWIMKDRARDAANHILDGAFNHPTNSRILNFPDIPLLGDINGDKREDVCIFRSAAGTWHCLDGKLLASGQRVELVNTVGWGMPTDQPFIADVDGDTKGDLIVYRTRSDTDLDVTTNGHWFVYSPAKDQVLVWDFAFGWSDSIPFTGKLNSDSKADLIIYDPNYGMWYSFNAATVISGSPVEFSNVQYGGMGGDLPVVGDFDHDTYTDFGIYRAAYGGTWHAFSRKRSIEVLTGVQFGENGDTPLVADFDGDGFVNDIGLYRSRLGEWHARTVYDSSNLIIDTLQYGAIRDKPLVGRLVNNTRYDPIIYRPYEGTWHSIRSTSSTGIIAGEPYGDPY